MTETSTNSYNANWRAQPRYPDPAVQILDERFRPYVLFSAAVERLYTGCRWAEGPVYFGDGRYLLWSDIPNNRILRWDESTGAVNAYRQPSDFANGNTRDGQGRLVTCEHGTRRVTRTEYDGEITVILDNWQGKPLNSPNDVVVSSDGAIWFTDPPFGILGRYEGFKAEPSLGQHIYRVDASGAAEIVCDSVLGPNGLAFSPDESTLYVVESRGIPNRKILAFDVSQDRRRLDNKRVFIDAGERGTPDGFRVDTDGNLWCGWGMGDEALDGVRIFAPEANPIGHIALPERCANVCFGGRQRNRIFMAASQSLYALYVNTQGIKGG
ncbi:MAG: gluconolactonase [Gammaproteobacteria bacterium]|jgi:gluconolactonase